MSTHRSAQPGLDPPEQTVFVTPWFSLVAKNVPGLDAPHFSIRTNDYVSVVALTASNQLILVRQLRPAVGTTTLELPSGHVDSGETPEEAARKELLEETGYVADTFECLGGLCPDTGRYGNRMWSFLARNARLTDDTRHQVEAGIQTVLFDGAISGLVSDPAFDNALNAAALLMAVAGGRVPV